MAADELYRQKLLEHYHNPHNRGHLENHDFSSTTANYSCGDSITIEGSIHDNAVIALKFSGSGCIISQATASMLTDYCMAKNIDELMVLDKEFIVHIIGIALGPTRLRCALLCLDALKEGLKKYKDSRDNHA